MEELKSADEYSFHDDTTRFPIESNSYSDRIPDSIVSNELEDMVDAEELKKCFKDRQTIIRTVQLYKIVETEEKSKLEGSKEEKLKFLLVGTDKTASFCKILRIYQLGKKKSLKIADDEVILSNAELRKYLSGIDKDLQKQKNSLKLVAKGVGFVGLIKLVYGYNFVLIDKLERIALIAGREIFSIKKLSYFPAYDPPQHAIEHPDSNVDLEYTWLLEKNLDVDKHLFCSFTYNLTDTLQNNVSKTSTEDSFNSQFTFNHYCANRFLQMVIPPSRKSCCHWIVPIIQGYVGQISNSPFLTTIFNI